MKFFAYCFVLIVGSLSAAAPASAHRAHVFATVQGNEIVADCRFSKKSPARNAKIEVFDAVSGRLLLSGRSDAKGAARLPLTPELAAEPVDLLIVLDAGEGHRDEWRIGADQLRGTAAPAPPETPAPAVADNPRCISLEELAAHLRDQETRLRAEAAAELAAKLAERNAQGPGLTEIIGGLGWIAGIFSLIAALKRKRRR